MLCYEYEHTGDGIKKDVAHVHACLAKKGKRVPSMCWIQEPSVLDSKFEDAGDPISDITD